MLGIFVAELFREGKIAYFIVVLSLLGFIILLSCLKFLTKSKIFEKLWSFNKFFVVVLVSFMVGFGGFFLHTQGLMKENSIEFNSQNSYVVTGNLKNSAVIYNKEVTFFLDDVFVSGDGKAHKLEKGMYVKMAKNLDDDAKELQDAKMGDRISFVGSIFTSEVLGKGGVFMFAYKNDVRYIATTNTEKLQNITKENVTTTLTSFTIVHFSDAGTTRIINFACNQNEKTKIDDVAKNGNKSEFYDDFVEGLL